MNLSTTFNNLYDARLFFDAHMAKFSTLRELVEVLQYTYVFGTRCLGIVLVAKRGDYSP